MILLRRLSLFCFFLLLLAGCVSGQRPAPAPLLPALPMAAEQARVSVFIQLGQGAAEQGSLSLGGLALVGENGESLALACEARQLTSQEMGQGQRFLGRGVVKAQAYVALRLMLAATGGVEPAPLELSLPGGFELQGGQSRCLFLVWQPGRARPLMVMTPEAGPLLADLAYVSCPTIDTLYLLRSDKNWVYGSLAIPGRPSFMAYSATRKKLYVLSAEHSQIVVVEVTTGRLVDRFKVPLTSSPSFFMSADGEQAYVLSQDDSELLRLDLASGTLQQRRRLPYRPSRLIWDDEGGQLIVAAALSQALYFLDPLTLQRRAMVSVASNPQGLLRHSSTLYVSEAQAGTLALVDMASLQTVKRVHVGLGPGPMVRNNNHLFVANQSSDSLAILSLHQQRLVREIPLVASPGELARSAVRPWLYATLAQQGSLAVVDQYSHRALPAIELGAEAAAVLFVE